MGALLEEISLRYGIDLETALSLQRRITTLVEATGKGRLVLVGASHMCRTAEFLSADCFSLAYPEFKSDKDKIHGIAKQLEMMELGPEVRIVLDLLSNSANLGTDDNGLPTPAIRGGWQLPHLWVLDHCPPPPTTLKRFWKLSAPL